MQDPAYFDAVRAHYERGDIAAAILEALRAAGKDLAALIPDDLAPYTYLQQFGKAGTLALAQFAGIQAGERVLDVGSGLGGPARTLAAALGCDVTGLDLTPSSCEAATTLTARAGLGHRVRFQTGNALAMPFTDGAFDVVWTEQFAMHVADKERLYREVHRVLRPGGRLVLREFFAGPVAPLHYPVPWDRDGTISHLWPAERVWALLGEIGFRECAVRDLTREALARHQQAPPPEQGAARLLFGDALGPSLATLARNYAEGRLLLIQAVFERA